MSSETWDAIKITVGITLLTVVATMIVLALCRPSNDTLAGRTNAIVARCGAVGADVTSRGWIGEHWLVRCRDGKPYACVGTDVVNCAER